MNIPFFFLSLTIRSAIRTIQQFTIFVECVFQKRIENAIIFHTKLYTFRFAESFVLRKRRVLVFTFFLSGVSSLVLKMSMFFLTNKFYTDSQVRSKLKKRAKEDRFGWPYDNHSNSTSSVVFNNNNAAIIRNENNVITAAEYDQQPNNNLSFGGYRHHQRGVSKTISNRNHQQLGGTFKNNSSFSDETTVQESYATSLEVEAGQYGHFSLWRELLLAYWLVYAAVRFCHVNLIVLIFDEKMILFKKYKLKYSRVVRDKILIFVIYIDYCMFSRC